MTMRKYQGNARDRTNNQTKRRNELDEIPSSPLEFARTLGEKIVFPVDMNHSIFENALPLIFDPSNLVIGTENDIAHAWTLLRFLLSFRVRII